MAIKYNIYTGFLILLSAINLSLLYSGFNLTDELAAVFVLLNLVLLSQMIIMLPFEQFIFCLTRDFQELEDRATFFSIVFYCSVIISFFAFGCFLLLSGLFIETVVPSLQGKDLVDSMTFFALGTVACTACPLLVIQQYLNAQYRIGFSYALNAIPLVCLFGYLLQGFFSKLSLNGYFLAIGAGNMIALSFGTALVWSSLRKPHLSYYPFMIRMMRESLFIKAAHNLHNGALLLSMNYWSELMTASVIGVFFGIKRLADALQQVVNIPLTKTLPKVYSDSHWRENSGEVRKIIWDSAKNSFVFFMLVLAILILILIFSSMESRYLADTNDGVVEIMLFGFTAYAILVCWDLPNAMVILRTGNSLSFYISNIGFSLAMLAGYLYGAMLNPLYSFFVALIAGQIFLFLVNRSFAQKDLRAW